ncbi:MAG: xanthine dehydrogenase family protein, partial [Thermomicrobiales bacterium]|nr:xanthine dehydrogenase family protein [Thermomicrobiales bacterium]
MTDTVATSVIGTRARRLDADDKVAGRARYATDLRLPGMLYGKIVRGDRPHARIVGIDVSAAEALPGVEAIATAADAPGRYGEAIEDQTVFARDRVRYVGEPICAVAAESAEIAELAASLIEIDYEDLPGVFDPVEALRPGAALVHENAASYPAPDALVRRGNVCAQVVLEQGDVASAFARADYVVEGTYAAHSVHQTPMETRAAIADVDARGRLTVHSSTQHPFGVRHQLHAALGLPYGDIRVIAEIIGGGFGSKLEATVEIYAAVLARKTGRPVRVVNTREEDFISGNPRHPMQIHIRSALAADGTILARETKTIMDAGAYATGSPTLAGVAALLAPGPYRIANLTCEAVAVYTNKMPFGAFRGPTGPQTVFAVETHTDEIARALGMDRLEFRLRNIFEEGDTAHSGQVLAGVGLRDAVERAAAAIGWGRIEESSAPGLLRGKGLACAWWLTTAGSSGCGIQMNEDGTVVVQTGATEIGTGAVMAGVAQVVAEELGITPDKIRIVWGDTDATPMDAGAQGSRTLFNMGRAAADAAQQVRAELLRRAADLLEAAEADLEVREGRVSVRGAPDHGVAYADLVAGQMWASQPVVGRGAFLVPPTPYEPGSVKGTLFPYFNAPSFHCHAADVEVDPETGRTRV